MKHSFPTLIMMSSMFFSASVFTASEQKPAPVSWLSIALQKHHQVENKLSLAADNTSPLHTVNTPKPASAPMSANAHIHQKLIIPQNSHATMVTLSASIEAESPVLYNPSSPESSAVVEVGSPDFSSIHSHSSRSRSQASPHWRSTYSDSDSESSSDENDRDQMQASAHVLLQHTVSRHIDCPHGRSNFHQTVRRVLQKKSRLSTLETMLTNEKIALQTISSSKHRICTQIPDHYGHTLFDYLSTAEAHITRLENAPAEHHDVYTECLYKKPAYTKETIEQVRKLLISHQETCMALVLSQAFVLQQEQTPAQDQAPDELG